MFEISSKKVDFGKKNEVIKRNINLDQNLDCFILISTNDEKLSENLLNNTLEYLIDKISTKNAYKDFSIALESINGFLKTWRQDQEKEFNLKMTVGILTDNKYIFSNIGKSSLYLINSNSEIIELTAKDENKKDFSYVSSGDLVSGEIVISSTVRLLNYLSKSDLLDGLVLSDDINIFNKNIKNILKSEILEENILVSSIKFINKKYSTKENYLDKAKDLGLKAMDNKYSKQAIAYILVGKDKILEQSKMVKNIVFLGGIAIAIIFLYSILSTLIGITTQNEKVDLAKTEIIEIKNYISLASENISNIEAFEKNINNAETLVTKIEDEKMFLNDLLKIKDDINILKKQFNKIETFESNPDNSVYLDKFENPVKLIKNSLKPYVITEKGVVGPILANTKPKNYTFNSLGTDENFIDAAFIGDNMYLLTSKSQIVKFTKSGYFSYIDVIGQDAWEQAKSIETYAQNIYLVSSNKNQINKHSLYGDKFKSAIGYLKDEDMTQVGEMQSVAIDGGFYILKKDLSIVKFYSNPYRLESIVLNNLPKNYNNTLDSNVELKVRKDLNYVYLLMDNKIWVLKPNTKNFKNTRSLTYIGQIEGGSNDIKDFFINYDGEINILNDSGIYKLNFEISDDRLILR